MTLLTVALAVTALAGSGCTASHTPPLPDASAVGLFPRHMSDNEVFRFNAGTLLRDAAGKPGTGSYEFDASAPRDQLIALVANCTSGRVHLAGVSGPCTGHASGLATMCGGNLMHLPVTVDQPQRRRWGVAVYRVGPCDGRSKASAA